MLPDLATLLSDPLAVDVIRDDPWLRSWVAVSQTGWRGYVPDDDEPEKFHQPYSFYHSRDLVSMVLGGNGSGKTTAAAAKVSKFVLFDQPPPRRDTPFWIISNTYDQVSGVCWAEKFHGEGHIPIGEVDWDRVRWLNVGLNWPLAVPLRPWPKSRGGDPGKNWILEFKSYEQGRRALQARSIGGFWFSEQFPLDLFLEVLRACREYMYPGGQIAEFCPIEPELCLWVERMMDTRPKSWGFYRMNTECNRKHLAKDWYDQFVAAIPDEMKATRLTGALATFEGSIFPTFSVRPIDEGGHVIKGPVDIPVGAECYFGLDWGASVEHPFACVWGFRDWRGVYTIYDEYWTNSQTVTLDDHAAKIKEITEDWFVPTYRDEPRRPNWGVDTMFCDPENMIAMRDFGGKGLNCHIASKNVDEGIDLIRVMLKYHPEFGGPRLRIHERCKHLIEEMRKYRWERKTKNEIGGRTIAVARPRPLKRDDDTLDSMRYLLFSAEKSRGAQIVTTGYGEWQRKHRTIQLDLSQRMVGANANGSGNGYHSGSGQKYDKNGSGY